MIGDFFWLLFSFLDAKTSLRSLFRYDRIRNIMAFFLLLYWRSSDHPCRQNNHHPYRQNNHHFLVKSRHYKPIPLRLLG